MVLKLQAFHEKGDKNAHMGPLSTHASFCGCNGAGYNSICASISARILKVTRRTISQLAYPVQ